MSILGTGIYISSTAVGDAMFGPALSVLTSAIVGGAKVVGVGATLAGAGYVGYRMYERNQYLTVRNMDLDKNWGEFGLSKMKNTFLGEKEIKPRYIQEEKVEDYVYRAYYKLPAGMGIRHIREKIEEIELFLNAEVDVYRHEEYAIIEIGTGKMYHKEQYDKDILLDKLRAKEYVLPLIVGTSRTGFQIVDLIQHPHFLVGGQTGGGKSVFMRQALITLLYYVSPEKLRMYMVDLKGGLEFQLFENAPHVEGIAKGQYEALEMLMEIEDEMERRFELLYDAKVENVIEYANDESGVDIELPPHDEEKAEQLRESLPFILLAIDEFAELSPEEYGKNETWLVPDKWVSTLRSLDMLEMEGRGNTAKEKKPYCVKAQTLMQKIHSIVSRLLRLARALGIHIILATQRPDAKVLPGQLKQNIPATVAFKVRNKVNSQILLDSDSAAFLPPNIKGRCILQVGVKETETQVPYLTTKEARKLINELAGPEVVEQKFIEEEISASLNREDWTFPEPLSIPEPSTKKDMELTWRYKEDDSNTEESVSEMLNRWDKQVG